MAKTIIKELIIILLLCLAIILVLGVLLYEYAPMSKTIPNPVSYTTPEEVQQELVATSEVDENKVIMTYEIDSSDLNNYARIQNYKPGKANPFAAYGSDTTSGNTTGNNNTTTGTTNNSNSSQTGSSNETTTSGGQFFPDKGTK